MDPFEASDRRREAQRRLWARRRRTGELRTRVVALTLVGFVLLWGVVFTQMATGNDPVLGAGHHSHRRAVVQTDRRETRGADEPEPEPEFQPEPEPEYVPEPEPEAEPLFEPEVVETTQS
jgi:hypothetical protein